MRDVINNKLEQIEQKSRTIRFIMNAIKSIKNANIIESINEKINDSPVIFQYLIKGYEALQNMTEEEKIQAKFLKDLINLNYNINEEETFKKDARDIESYYRERARKRFDHNSGFCDEELDINGNWVLKENAQIANRLILAKKKLLRKFREASYDDH